MALGSAAFSRSTVVHAADEWPQSPNTPAAQSRFDEGVEMARASKFMSASEAFRVSFEQSPSLSALFAWAQSERLSGHCEIASPLYERFLKKAPTPEQQQAAQIALRRCTDMPPPADTSPAASGLPLAPRQDTVQVVTPHQEAAASGVIWPLAATGGALVVAGAVMLLVSQFENNSAQNADSYQNYREARERSRTEQVIGWSCAGLGIATLGAAALLAWRPQDQMETASPSLAFIPSTSGPGSLLAALKGRF